jgi:hypothetical protein
MIVNFVGGRVARFSLGVIGSVRRQAQEAPALTGSVLYSTLERPGYTTEGMQISLTPQLYSTVEQPGYTTDIC